VIIQFLYINRVGEPTQFAVRLYGTRKYLDGKMRKISSPTARNLVTTNDRDADNNNNNNNNNNNSVPFIYLQT
jgi:hypothetical protein